MVKKLMPYADYTVNTGGFMAKPQVQARVDPNLKKRLGEWQEEQGIETEAEAVRRLLPKALDHEQGVAADGGEVLDHVDALRQQQRREERRDAYETALLGAGIAIGVAVLTGALDGLAGLLLGLGVGVALIGTALRPLMAGREVSADE
jgi:hypothetical protein